MRLIDADKLIKEVVGIDDLRKLSTATIGKALSNCPTVDAVPVVRCHECILHDNCNTEEAYKLCRIENPFCCAGKRREPQAEDAEENSFLMQRFMKQE